MSEVFRDTVRRVVKRHRCPCQWPFGEDGWRHVVLTDEEIVDLAGERGRIAAGGEPQEVQGG